MQPVAHQSRVEQLLGRMAELAVRRPAVTIVVAAILVALAILAAATRLELKTSNLDLVDPRLPTIARFRAFAHTFGTPNMLVVVLESTDPAALRVAADRVAAGARAVPGVRSVLARLPYDPSVLAGLGVESYLVSRDGRLLFVFVQPADPESSAARLAPVVHEVRRVVAAAGLDALGVRAGLTGLPQYALDDREVIARDISWLSAVSYVLVLLLFATAFRAVLRPCLAMLVLAAAVAGAVGLAALVPGHLTLVSAFAFSTLFGLGIDYGIHVVARVEEHEGDGQPRAESVVAAVRGVARGLWTGALTTAVALLTFLVSGFRGFAELGWIAGAGLLLSLAAMTTLLPAILCLAPTRRRPAPGRGGSLLRGLLVVQRSRLGWAVAAVCILGLVLGPPGFDRDYLNLQPRDSEAVRLEREMVARSAFSPQFAGFVRASAEDARALGARLRQEPTVGAVRTSADLEVLDSLGAAVPGEWETFHAGFVSRDGRHAVYAYPSGNVWDPAFQDAFLERMRALDPEVTGMPVVGRFMIDRSQRALRITAALSALAVLTLVWADFRDLRRTLLALLPAVGAIAGLFGAMRVAGLAFNPLDVMALPAVVGIAVDNGVHVVHRFVAERGDLSRTLAGTGRAVMLCSLTTMAAFGSLAFTVHRGLASFALVLTLGVALALALSLLLLPDLLVRVAPRLGLDPAAPSPALSLDLDRVVTASNTED